MKKKEILFIAAASGLGDRIAIIPKLLELKEKGYNVSLLCYEPAYFTLFYDVDEPMRIYRENELYDQILRIPRNKIKLLWFMIRNLLRFHEAYTPVHTFFSGILWRLLARKYRYSFKNPNDVNKHKDIITGMLENKPKPLFAYKESLNLRYSKSYEEKFWLQSKKFITLFVSMYTRCMPVQEILEIVSHISKKWYTTVLIGWEREKRIVEYLATESWNIKNLLWKTDFLEVSSLLSDAALNISMDGWLMRLWHLMNKNNISVQNTSFFIMQPPVDNKHSFNLRKYTYPECTPCSYFGEPKGWEKHRIRWCIFYGTKREWECRFSTTPTDVIQLIDRILPS